MACPLGLLFETITRMWTDAQRDGRFPNIGGALG